MDTERLCFPCDCREEVGYPLSTTIACHIPFQFVPFSEYNKLGQLEVESQEDFQENKVWNIPKDEDKMSGYAWCKGASCMAFRGKKSLSFAPPKKKKKKDKKKINKTQKN